MVTQNKMLETQISQVAQQQASQAMPGGSFPGQPQPNPNGHANSISLQSGTAYERAIDPRSKDNLTKKSEPRKENVVATPESHVEKEPEKQEKQGEGKTKEKELEKENQPYVPHPPYKPLIPYPQRLKQTKLDNQYKKFI